MSKIENNYSQNPDGYPDKNNSVTFEEYLEPAPKQPSYEGVKVEVPTLVFTEKIQPASLQFDIRKEVIDGVTSEKVANRKIIRGETVIPHAPAKSFIKSPNTLVELLYERATQIKPGILARGLHPKVFEFTRLPFSSSAISLDENDGLREISKIDWVQPGFAIEPIATFVDRSSEATGLTKAKYNILRKIYNDPLSRYDNVLGASLPTPELVELPLATVISYLDLKRIQDQSDTIYTKQNGNEVPDYRARSLALRESLLEAVKQLNPDLVEDLTTCRTLNELYRAIPPEVKFQLDWAHQKMVAMRKVGIVLDFASRLIFFKAEAMNISKRFADLTSRVLISLNQYQDDEDFSNASHLSAVLRNGLEAFPLPDITISDKGPYEEAYLDFQERVHKESLRLAEVAA